MSDFLHEVQQALPLLASHRLAQELAQFANMRAESGVGVSLVLSFGHGVILVQARFKRITCGLFASGVQVKGKDLASGMVLLSTASGVTRL